MMAAYAELQVTTNFSFLRGASHPDELVLTAAALGHSAVAVTDRNTLAGVVRAHSAAKQVGIRLVVGVRLDLRDAPSLLCFPTDRAAYGRLCRLLTLGNRRAPKGNATSTAPTSPSLPRDRWPWPFRRMIRTMFSSNFSRNCGALLMLAATSPPAISIAATTPAACIALPPSPDPLARPWSPPTTSITTPPTAAPCRTC